MSTSGSMSKAAIPRSRSKAGSGSSSADSGAGAASSPASARLRAAASASRSAGRRAVSDGRVQGRLDLGQLRVGVLACRCRAGRSRRRSRARPRPGSRSRRCAPTMSRASETITPSKPSSPRSTPPRIVARERRRLVGVELRQQHVRRHDGARAGLDRGQERAQLALAQLLERQVDDRQREVRVLRRVAVPGEVLRAHRDALGLVCGDPGRGVGADELGVGAEAAHADDRIVGVGVDVGIRREVEVDADRAQFERDGAGDLGGQSRHRRCGRAGRCRDTASRSRSTAA